VVASVCTGAFLVAKTGMAAGKSMTTHQAFKQRFRQDFPKVTVPNKARFVRDGALWSSAGISAGIDTSLQLVNAVWGAGVAKKVQQAFLEYCPEPPFPC
jgi:transcriptional regulator GlxA family with amidase domain